MRQKSIRTAVETDPREAKREPVGPAASDRRSTMDRADPYPTLPRDVDHEPTVEREPETKPERDRGRSVDKADPYPGLRRRVLFVDGCDQPTSRNLT